jgi:hypothetical protein
MMPSALEKVISPAPTNPTAATVVALDDCRMAVLMAPVTAPDVGVRVKRMRAARMRSAARRPAFVAGVTFAWRSCFENVASGRRTPRRGVAFVEVGEQAGAALLVDGTPGDVPPKPASGPLGVVGGGLPGARLVGRRGWHRLRGRRSPRWAVHREID